MGYLFALSSLMSIRAYILGCFEGGDFHLATRLSCRPLSLTVGKQSQEFPSFSVLETSDDLLMLKKAPSIRIPFDNLLSLSPI